MKYIRNTLLGFGLLDIFSIVLLSPQIYNILINYNHIPDLANSRIKVILMIFGYLLLFVSAAGLVRAKTFGMIAYYIQFPVRLVVWIFSFGFITYLTEYTGNQFASDWLFRIVIILEFFRLYFTIRIHWGYFRNSDS